MTDHIIDPVYGVIHAQPMPHLDAAIEQNGVTYAGRLYPVRETPAAGPSSEQEQQKTPLRSSDGKILLLGDAEGLWAWSRRVKDWQLFGWEVVLRVYRERTLKKT